MKKVALLYVLAVFVPSLALAWLAVRSLSDQQFLLERQQSLLCQAVADAKAKEVQDALAGCLAAFKSRVAGLLGKNDARQVARAFDERLLQDWPLAQVGFAVTLNGELLAPAPFGRAEARKFYADNSRFLANLESAQVYWNPKQNFSNLSNTAFTGGFANAAPQLPTEQAAASEPGYAPGRSAPRRNAALQQPLAQPPAGATQDRVSQAQNQGQVLNNAAALQQQLVQSPALASQDRLSQAQNQGQAINSAAAQQASPEQPPESNRRFNPGKVAQPRNVMPQQQAAALSNKSQAEDQGSRVTSAETEFRQLIGEDTEGALARFVDNRLSVLFWCRPARDPQLVFGAQLALARLVNELRPLVERVERTLGAEFCLALLDDTARPAALSQPGFAANWKRPFVATEIGESLPHWEVAVYLLDPAKLTRSARMLKLTLGLVIAVLVLAIGVGSWLIVADLQRHLTLARQKTDFVSNVSHELKTPLTSIRMFSELLAEGRVADRAKQQSYLGIITAETARLTRLINNVLDFARLERGEKKYQFQQCDLAGVAAETAAAYRPHLEAAGFQFDCDLPDAPLCVHGDPDALAQVIVNLLSNAEKYAGDRKEVTLRVARPTSPLPHAEVAVLDRGLGVPQGCEEKIFEQFYRAHDSLASGIQGSGLGLTLARQIARAHGGEVVYEPRPGGGSSFSLRLPLSQ